MAKSLRVRAKASQWGTPTGEQIEVVRLLGAGKTIAVEYEHLPQLIAELASALVEHNRKEGET